MYIQCTLNDKPILTGLIFRSPWLSQYMIIVLDCIQTTYEGHINTTDATATRKKNGINGIRDA